MLLMSFGIHTNPIAGHRFFHEMATFLEFSPEATDPATSTSLNMSAGSHQHLASCLFVSSQTVINRHHHPHIISASAHLRQKISVRRRNKNHGSGISQARIQCDQNSMQSHRLYQSSVNIMHTAASYRSGFASVDNPARHIMLEPSNSIDDFVDTHKSKHSLY